MARSLHSWAESWALNPSPSLRCQSSGQKGAKVGILEMLEMLIFGFGLEMCDIFTTWGELGLGTQE